MARLRQLGSTLLVWAVGWLIAPLVALGATRAVPAPFPTIGQAITASLAGDTVLIGPGTYHERLNTNGKRLTLIGTQGRDLTIVDGDFLGNVLVFSGGGTLRGLTFQRGQAAAGGGVNAFRVSPTPAASLLIEDCTFLSNRAGGSDSGEGGGLRIGTGLSPRTVQRCIFQGNSSGDVGGGAWDYDSASFDQCEFRTNSAGNFGGGLFGLSSRVSYCLFLSNVAGSAGGGFDGGPKDMSYNTFISNRHNNFFAFGGAIHVRSASVGGSSISNNLISNSGGSGIYCGASVGSVRIACNNSWGNTGPPYFLSASSICDTLGKYNISADPLFCSAETGDYTLKSTSPCAGGVANCGLIGAYGVGCQVIAVTPSTWSRIKSLVR